MIESKEEEMRDNAAEQSYVHPLYTLDIKRCTPFERCTSKSPNLCTPFRANVHPYVHPCPKGVHSKNRPLKGNKAWFFCKYRELCTPFTYNSKTLQFTKKHLYMYAYQVLPKSPRVYIKCNLEINKLKSGHVITGRAKQLKH